MVLPVGVPELVLLGGSISSELIIITLSWSILNFVKKKKEEIRKALVSISNFEFELFEIDTICGLVKTWGNTLDFHLFFIWRNNFSEKRIRKVPQIMAASMHITTIVVVILPTGSTAQNTAKNVTIINMKSMNPKIYRT